MPPILRVCFVAVVFLATASARADALTSSLELTTFVGSATYRVKAETPSGKLDISCVAGCTSHVDFEDDVGGITIYGAYALGDNIVTLWSVGDGDLAVVYHIDDGGVRKVLETPVKGMFSVPDIEVNGQPAFIIPGETAGDLIRDQEQGITPPSHSVAGDLWVWNGQIYVKAHK